MPLLFLLLVFSISCGGPRSALNFSSENLNFECIPLDNNGTRFATRPAIKNATQQLTPLLIWESSEFSASGYTPERRCKEVTFRLKTAIDTLGSSPDSLAFTIDSINNLPVLCYVQSKDYCDSNHVIFTLNNKNRANPAYVMAAMLKFLTTGTGTSLIE